MFFHVFLEYSLEILPKPFQLMNISSNIDVKEIPALCKPLSQYEIYNFSNWQCCYIIRQQTVYNKIPAERSASHKCIMGITQALLRPSGVVPGGFIKPENMATIWPFLEQLKGSFLLSETRIHFNPSHTGHSFSSRSLPRQTAVPLKMHHTSSSACYRQPRIPRGHVLEPLA